MELPPGVKKDTSARNFGLGVRSPIPGRRSHELFLLPTAGEEVFVWLLRGRGAPGSVRRAGPAHCAIWRRAAGKLQPGSAGRARARLRPARGCGSRAASGRRPGGLGGSEARANAGRWAPELGGREGCGPGSGVDSRGPGFPQGARVWPEGNRS